MPAAKSSSSAIPERLKQAAIEHFCARSHNSWRRKLLAHDPAQRGKARMRLRGGVMVDVNQPWSKLHPSAKADNRRAAADAIEAVAKFPADREAAADYVHRCWIKRNRRDPAQPKALFAPYVRLSETEKDKDRAHVDAIKASLAAVRKTAKARAKRPRAAPYASVNVPAAAWARLERAAAALSAHTDRAVAADALLAASVEAMVAAIELSVANKRAKPRRR